MCIISTFIRAIILIKVIFGWIRIWIRDRFVYANYMQINVKQTTTKMNELSYVSCECVPHDHPAYDVITQSYRKCVLLTFIQWQKYGCVIDSAIHTNLCMSFRWMKRSERNVCWTFGIRMWSLSLTKWPNGTHMLQNSIATHNCGQITWTKTNDDTTHRTHYLFDICAMWFPFSTNECIRFINIIYYLFYCTSMYWRSNSGSAGSIC